MTSNYFDDKGNYINIENLSLKQIYERAFDEGYKKGYIDGALHPANEEGNEAAYNEGYAHGIVTKLSHFELNGAINTIKAVCIDNNTCNTCPMNWNCNEQPAKWIGTEGET